MARRLAALLAASIVAPLAALAPSAALARDDDCAIRVEGREGVVRSGDVEVRPGDAPRDVVAFGGAVRVRSGATAKDVVAMGGPVIVEKGATVRGDATSIGSDVRAEPGARIEGDANAVGGSVRAAKGALGGKRSSVRVEIDGQPLAAKLTDELRSALRGHRCDVQVEQQDE